MMNLQDKYPKTWKDFEKWYNEYMPKDVYGTRLIELLDLLKYPFEMQLGVYLKYLDERGIILSEGYSSYHKSYRYIICDNGEWTDYSATRNYANRETAATEAIEQAFKIREKQLK